MRIIIIITAGLVFYGCAHQNQKDLSIDEITAEELYEHVSFLASDSLKGRKPGTQEADVAAGYIRDHFKQAGLDLLAKDGFQYFDVVTSVEAGPDNKLTFNGFEAKLHQDFVPMAFSDDTVMQADVIFVGYGFDFDEDSISWHSYHNVDVEDKFVLVLRGDPDPERAHSIFESYNSLRHKVLTAKDHGAAGVLFVTPANLDPEDNLIEMTVRDGRSGAGIQVAHIKRGR